VTELSELEGAEQEQAVAQLARATAREPFDLGTGPLLRVQLLQLGEQEHVLLATMHHIISDGWSMGVLISELSTLYQAYREGQSSPLKELEIQYADYAVWQREWLQGEVLAEQLGYWSEQLAGAPTLLELPADKARPAMQSYRGGRLPLLVEPGVTEAVEALSRAEGATLFMSLLAAWQVLLSRYSGQADIVVGTPVAGRNQRETEELIGFFVNTLVLRTDLSGGPTFRELLARVREVCLGAYAHQEVPFEKLVDELGLERELSHAPLFQVLLTLQNAPRATVKLAGLELRGMSGEPETVKFDLTLDLTETPQGVAGWLGYNTDLFEAQTAERLVRHLQLLIEGLVREPDQRVTAQQLLTAGEREQLVSAWNQTERDYPGQCLQELFAAQAERTPEATAVSFAGAELSYGELNRRANQVAHYLRRRGVGVGTLVGICVERSLEMMVGCWGC